MCSHILLFRGRRDLVKPDAACQFFLVQGEGFEPPKAKPDDLQSPPVGHLGNPAYIRDNLAVFLDETFGRAEFVYDKPFLLFSLTQVSGLCESTWSRLSDSNRRPAVYKTAALTS